MRTLIASSALAALLFAPSLALAQASGSGQYCLKSGSGDAKCAYQTMAQCEQAKQSGDECVSRAETTGAGSGSSSSGAGSSPSGSSPSGSSPSKK